MSFPGYSRHFPAESSSSGDRNNHLITSPNDPLTALTNLVTLRTRMDSLQRFLSDSLTRRTLLSTHHMNRVTSELTSAIHQVIVNGATLLSFSQPDPTPIDPNPEGLDESDKEDERIETQFGEDFEIVEIDAVELLAEHIHFCEICGKGFKRDANLRMHMRAHGNQFKSPRALARPDRPAGDSSGDRRTRFSCPYNGCNRNQKHKNFRPLKSVICVKNHFKRSHCPKTYSCDRCHKKSFSVMADLKSHLKNCGNSSKWKCCCGSTFSRKDKLFGHIALFEGHMPAVTAIADEEEEIPVPNMIQEEQTPVRSAMVSGDELLFEGLLEDFGSADNQCLQELMMTLNSGANSSSANANLSFSRIDDFFNF